MEIRPPAPPLLPAVASAPRTGGGQRRSHPAMRTIVALMLREMSTRYGRSAGGYVWAVLEPLGSILLLALGFSLLVRAPSLGNSFIFFYATGFLPFHIYQQIAVAVARSIMFSKPLLFYPTVSWIDAVLARFILNGLTSILVTYLRFAGFLAFSDNKVLIETGPLLQAMGLSLLLGFGIGTLNCALMGLFHTWDMIWSVATRPLFLASGIIFIYEDLPRQIQQFLWFNPLIHITGLMRAGFFPLYEPEYISAAYVLAIALITTAMGLLLLWRHNRDILQDN